MVTGLFLIYGKGGWNEGAKSWPWRTKKKNRKRPKTQPSLWVKRKRRLGLLKNDLFGKKREKKMLGPPDPAVYVLLTCFRPSPFAEHVWATGGGVASKEGQDF